MRPQLEKVGRVSLCRSAEGREKANGTLLVVVLLIVLITVRFGCIKQWHNTGGTNFFPHVKKQNKTLKADGPGRRGGSTCGKDTGCQLPFLYVH